jgi:oligoribonuclease NrnB/cAMP/cGMP phosphodiesterase (DHH superfamily)
MVDFSYKRDVIVKMAETAKSILILDHHKTAQEDLAPFIVPELTVAAWNDNMCPVVSAVFDMERSGAGLTWDFFEPDAPRPALVNYVEDRDLWRFKLEGSREVSAYIFSNEYTFENWDRINAQLEDGLQYVINIGAAIERKHHKDVAELVDVCKRRMKIGGVEVWGASLPYTLTSDAGNLMAQGEPFAACYWDTPKGRVFSLRSTQEGSDVSAIASQYGGGGHKNASGFQVPLDQINQFEIS